MMKPWVKYLASGIIIAGITLVVLYQIATSYINAPLVIKETVVEIPKGASLNKISCILSAKKLIMWPFVWKTYARVTGQSALVQAGEYLVPAGSTGKNLLNLFVSGKVIQHKLVLLPGMTVSQVLALLSHLPKINNDLKGMSDLSLADYLGMPEKSAEGMFYADTYFYTAHIKASAIMLQAYTKLRQKLNHLWQERAENLPYKTAYDALIVASLIAKETGTADERKKIAGVFIRRLQKGMRLQSDPTVIYGMGDLFDGKLTHHHLQKKNAYNTYLINGLPPTPISLVTEADIEAALHPFSDKTLYFVAKGDGAHAFSKTLKAHQRAIKKYQIHRKHNYSSMPPSASNHSHASREEQQNDAQKQ